MSNQKFIPSIHYCEKMNLYTFIDSKEELEDINSVSFTITADARRFHLAQDYWYETEKECLSYLILELGLR